DADIPPEALFRRQVGIALEDRRCEAELLEKGRVRDPGPDRRMEPRLAVWNAPGAAYAVGRRILETVIPVLANGGAEIELVQELPAIFPDQRVGLALQPLLEMGWKESLPLPLIAPCQLVPGGEQRRRAEIIGRL